MKLRIKLKNRSQLESKRSECFRDKGSYCYMYPEKDPAPSGKTKIEPVKLKKEDKMIRKPSKDSTIRSNEKEIESALFSDEVSGQLKAEILSKIESLESDEELYREFFSRVGAASDLINDCIDDIS